MELFLFFCFLYGVHEEWCVCVALIADYMDLTGEMVNTNTKWISLMKSLMSDTKEIFSEGFCDWERWSRHDVCIFRAVELIVTYKKGVRVSNNLTNCDSQRDDDD